MRKTSDSPMPCPACGDKDHLRLVRRTAHHTTKDGVTIPFLDELTVCGRCSEEFYTYEQSLAHSRALTAATREAEGLFTPDRIQKARQSLGLSQEAFERALGIGRKTVVRWERGTVPPSRAANGLLWFAENYPATFMEYARQRTSPKAEGSQVSVASTTGRELALVATRRVGPVRKYSDVQVRVGAAR